MRLIFVLFLICINLNTFAQLPQSKLKTATVGIVDIKNSSSAVGQGDVLIVKPDLNEIEVSGDMNAQSVQLVMQTMANGFLYCFANSHFKDTNVDGKVAIKFQIAKLGQLQSVEIKQDSFKDSILNGCIMSKVKKLIFPEPKSGLANVVYPIYFKSLMKAKK